MGGEVLRDELDVLVFAAGDGGEVASCLPVFAGGIGGPDVDGVAPAVLVEVVLFGVGVATALDEDGAEAAVGEAVEVGGVEGWAVRVMMRMFQMYFIVVHSVGSSSL